MLNEFPQDSDSLKRRLTNRGKFRLIINDSDTNLNNQKATYRFHSKYRRLLLGCKLILVPILSVALIWILCRIYLFFSLTSTVNFPLFQFSLFEFIEELEDGYKMVEETSNWRAKPAPYFFTRLEMINKTGYHFYIQHFSLNLFLATSFYSKEHPTIDTAADPQNQKTPDSKPATQVEVKLSELLYLENTDTILYPNATFKATHKLGSSVYPGLSKKETQKTFNVSKEKSVALPNLRTPIDLSAFVPSESNPSPLNKVEKKYILQVEIELYLATILRRIPFKLKFDSELSLRPKEDADANRKEKYSKTIWDFKDSKFATGIVKKFEVGEIKKQAETFFIQMPITNSLVDLILFPLAEAEVSFLNCEKESSPFVYNVEILKVFVEKRAMGVIFRNLPYRNERGQPFNIKGSPFEDKVKPFSLCGIKFKIIRCNNVTYGKALQTIGEFTIDLKEDI